MQSFIDVHIAASVDTSELAGFLSDHGLLGVWEQDGIIHLYWDDNAWSEDVLEQVHIALNHVGVSSSSENIAVRTIPSANWNEKWTESVQPIRIGQRILIRPSWVSVEPSLHDIEIILDPKQAFGTGHHVTTQLLLEWLEVGIQGGERILDLGTGSGLLAMVALRLGARSALGIDNDSLAIACAKEYAQVNHFDTNLELRVLDLCTLSAENSFDLVVANIDRRTLMGHHAILSTLSHSKTNLLMSGILDIDQDDIVTTYTKAGWRHVKVWRREEWIALHFQRA